MLLLSAAYFISCEKDDICAEGTPTTPSVVIEFYERDNRTQPKSVFNLRVIAENMETPVLFSGSDVTSANTIRIPLRTDADTTTYRLIYNATATGGSANEDRITFNYTRNEIYVSRACGYKTLFYLGPDPNNDVLLQDTGDNFWISEVGVERTNIEDQDEAHIYIYF